MTAFRPYLCIAASAGSGKTFQLAHRVLRLLAMDAPPDGIGAYTFSRKAAGEIFDGIVQYLRAAAADDAGARAASDRIGLSHSRDAFLADLRRLFAHLHRLRIGTLDSRISQMLSAASVELGLPPEFSLMDTQSSEFLRLQARVLNRIFRADGLDEERADLFLHLFEEATYGQAEKNFRRQMERFLADHRATFLAEPSAAAWEGPDIADPPDMLSEETREELAGQLRAGIPERVSDSRARDALLKVVDACAAFHERSLWSRDAPSGSVWSRFLEEDSPVFTYYKKEYDLGEDLWSALRPLIDHVVAVGWDQARRRALALYGFLLAHETEYRRQAFPGGRLSFDDACTLMAGFDALAPAELAYRLDGEISHWLLDEFQDTNRLQWSVLRPFLEEVLQDPEERRSFFYVGDVKQAIYAWRGGDSTLFGQVLRDWPLIKKIDMDRSFRSAKPVLDLVNRLLLDLPATDAWPGAAVERWNAEYHEHRTAREDLPGYAEVLQCSDADTPLPELVCRLAAEIPPGAEAAVLVRGNREGAEIANLLRAAGHRVSLEGAAEIRDDTAVEAVLAALTLAAHPADDFSRQLLRLADLEVDPLRLLERVQTDGLTAAVRELSARLPLKADAAFARARLARLTDLALEFDSLGDPSIDRFLAFVDKAHIKENEARGVIRVMTIHQSKGLGFDTVIVPVKAGGSIASVDTGSLVVSPVDAERPWVALLPPKDVCARIPELAEIHERALADSAYESLCLLYVALTRAKRRLHVVLDTPPKSKGSLNVLPNWLAWRLEGETPPAGGRIRGAETLAAFGDPDAPASGGSAVEAPAPPASFDIPVGRPAVQRLEPSQADAQPRRVEQAFRFFPGDGRALGSRVHELMERIDWAEAVDVDTFLAEAGESADSDAAAHVRAALRFAELRKPADATGLWREQKFESVLEDGWITGIFDRVVLFPDGAWIQDYKTNLRCDEETVAHYAPQMRLYRRVLADMLGFPEKNIRCQLLFTHTGDVKEVA